MTKKILDVTTEEQTKLWAEANEGAVHSCETCRSYAALREPFVRSDEASSFWTVGSISPLTYRLMTDALMPVAAASVVWL